MKRLIAITKKTVDFNVDTDAELAKIHEQDNHLTKDNAHSYTKLHNEGIDGGVFFTHDNGKFQLYVVETFTFKDVDKQTGKTVDKAAFVLTAIHNNRKWDDPKCVEIKNIDKTSEANINNFSYGGKNLIRLTAQTFDGAKEELAKKFQDFSEDKLL